MSVKKQDTNKKEEKTLDSCDHDWETFNYSKGYGELMRKCKKCGKEEWDDDLGNIYY